MATNPLPPTRKGLLAHVRGAKALTDAMIKNWNIPATIEDEAGDGSVVKRARTPEEHPEHHAVNWELLQRQAASLKAKADGLYIFAVQQGRIARERAHPANQASDAPELEL